MITYFVYEDGEINKVAGTIDSGAHVIWIDLIQPTQEEKEEITKVYDVKLFTQQESEEIESSSKYIETEKSIGINLNFLKSEDEKYVFEPVSFIIKGNLLITQREQEFTSFEETYQRIKSLKLKDGSDVFLTLLESRIDYDADLIESITDQITFFSKQLFVKSSKLNPRLLLELTAFRESTIAIRENIFEKQRILFAILKSKSFPIEDIERLRVMIKDVGSLLHHSSFNFERLEFLQNAFLGLVDMEQNRIIKIFTLVAVIFMPPTLIASVYGMNFRFMPELDELWGYPFAILVMILSSLLTLLVFKWKKWL